MLRNTTVTHVITTYQKSGTLGGKLTRIQETKKREYCVFYEEDPPERIEAIRFFNSHGARVYCEMNIPPEIQIIPIDQANEYLRQNPVRRQWDGLYFSGANEIGDADLDRLRHLPDLIRLKIFSRKISDEGVKHLIHLQKLECICLYSDEVTPVCLDTLRELPKLRMIDMQRCPKISQRAFMSAVATFKNDPEVYPPYQPCERALRARRNPGKSFVQRPRPEGFRSVNYTMSSSGTLPPELFEKDDIWNLLILGPNACELPPTIGNLRQLRELCVQSCDLSSLPETFGCLTFLERLRLYNNRLRELPPSFENLTALFEINLDNNNLLQFPPALLKLRALEKLRMVSNGITEIPEEIQNLQELRSLSLGDNQIASLPESISKLPHLNYLGIQRNPIKELPRVIWSMPSLITLNLSGSGIIELPPEAHQIPNLIYYNSNRVSEHLKRNSPPT